MTFVSAQYVKMPYKGEVTTDHWVIARHEAGSSLTLAHDSDWSEWQEYLAGGGTIEPYSEATTTPVLPDEPLPPPPLPPQPGPVLKSLHPESMLITTKPFELMLWGENFTMNTIVLFNGEKVLSMFVNDRQILASLSSGSWRSPGAYTVAVVTGEDNVTNRKTDELTFTFTEAYPNQTVPDVQQDAMMAEEDDGPEPAA